MAAQHMFSKKFSLAEHTAEQRRLHKQMLVRIKRQQQSRTTSSSVQSDVKDEEPGCSSGSSATGGGSQSSDEDDSESHEDDTDSEMESELDGYYFLQPVPTRQRRVLLREAGVKKIDSLEKDECRDIRSSREFCGCSCKVYCDPDSCSCAQADIKCQVRIKYEVLFTLINPDLLIGRNFYSETIIAKL